MYVFGSVLPCCIEGCWNQSWNSEGSCAWRLKQYQAWKFKVKYQQTRTQSHLYMNSGICSCDTNVTNATKSFNTVENICTHWNTAWIYIGVFAVTTPSALHNDDVASNCLSVYGKRNMCQCPTRVLSNSIGQVVQSGSRLVGFILTQRAVKQFGAVVWSCSFPLTHLSAGKPGKIKRTVGRVLFVFLSAPTLSAVTILTANAQLWQRIPGSQQHGLFGPEIVDLLICFFSKLFSPGVIPKFEHVPLRSG